MLKVGVLASGRGSNLQSIIDSIKAGVLKAEIKIVITDKAAAKALDRAEKYNIANSYINPKIYENKSDFEQAMIDLLEEHKVDLVVMAGFMRILSPYFVKHYRNRVMNIHPSLLPSFTGLHAQKQALDYGVKVAGCTVHFADEGMDTGPIILQATVPVMDDDTEETLSQRILEEEHRIYPKAIKLFSEGRLEVKDGKVLIINN
ncbi:phosphoribosylglycinamide formyltransferase [Orenia marismortui]|uniref:Phosphoribosylglycinamide formyltransferase n=1 Tax=Orenia marismortui TaxID=46469 RepID=A0A4V3GYB9_9FIRM|nr:phosphoribosylglycinamide formyltransferase [Orenia marismortui]TDX51823.1 formyltetrahydrofolate-dependent phosphoribosylglycinamide formyltransferase [Orenia marismortui]